MTTLSYELQQDPTNVGYAELGDVAASAALNAKTRQCLGGVTRARFAIWAASGPRSVIEDTAADHASPFRASALTLKDFLVGAADELDLTDSNVIGLLAAWHGAGLITSEQHDALIALGTHPCSRAEELGIADASPNAVYEARK